MRIYRTRTYYPNSTRGGRTEHFTSMGPVAKRLETSNSVMRYQRDKELAHGKEFGWDRVGYVLADYLDDEDSSSPSGEWIPIDEMPWDDVPRRYSTSGIFLGYR